MRKQDPDCDWAKISFRVFGERLNPEELTAATGITPDFHAKIGERPDIGSGESYRESLPPAKRGHWHLVSKAMAASTNLDDQAEEILQRLEGHQAYFAALAKVHNIDFFVGWSGDRRGATGPPLSPNLLEKMKAFGAKIDFDVYDRND